MWREIRRFFLLRVLHADDSPHRIAGGVAVGTFVAFTPTIGLQTLIAVAVAAILRVNKIVCIPLVWITNPFTLVPIYLLCYQLGSFLVGAPSAATPTHPIASIQAIDDGTTTGGMELWLHLEFWKNVANQIMRSGLELWIGCLVAGTFFSIVTYFVTRSLVTKVRRRRSLKKRASASGRATGRPALRPVKRPISTQRQSA